MTYFTRLCHRYLPVVFTSLILCLACKEKEVALGVGDPRVVGTWRLFQRTAGTDTNRVVTAIPDTPPQTITFTSDGRMSTMGQATDYYRNVKYYRVDSTLSGLQIRLIANVQELPGEPQGLRVGKDTLVLLPNFQPTLILSFVRAK